MRKLSLLYNEENMENIDILTKKTKQKKTKLSPRIVFCFPVTLTCPKCLGLAFQQPCRRISTA